MRRIVLALALAMAAGSAYAAEKTYQATGPVLEVRDDAIVVQKGNEKWEIAKNADTKVNGGDLKKGEKVTVHYKMTATSIDVAAASKKKAAKAK